MPKKERPIQLYLDSSDYSVFSDSRKISEENLKIKNTLISLVRKKMIEIRFSFIHVLEMAHISLKDRPLSILRFKTVAELCNNKAFKPLPEIEKIEFERIAKGNQNPTDIEVVINDNGQWFPDFSSTVGDFKKIITALIYDYLQKLNISQEQKRIAKKRILHDGNLTSEVFEYFSENREPLMNFLSTEFPLTDRFWKEDLIFKFYQGKISNRELLKEIQAGFFDPVNFIGWYIDKYEGNKPFPSWLRDMGSNNSKLIQDLREKYERLAEFGLQIGKSQKQLYADIKRIGKQLEAPIKRYRTVFLQNIWQKKQPKLLKIGLTEKNWETRVINSNLGDIPSIDFYMQALFRYVLNSTSNIRFKRTIRNSDYADLQHARYLPYVDIFSADNYMGNILKPLARNYNTVVVTSLKDILKEIDQIERTKTE